MARRATKCSPYTASDEARAQIHDVTVLMKGSETEISTQKLLHDTFTDWVRTDLPAASNILNPGGARSMQQNMRRIMHE